VKLGRLRRPKVSWSPSYADYRLKTNAAILWDMGHTDGSHDVKNRARYGNKTLGCG
jgi:hypothetical protein